MLEWLVLIVFVGSLAGIMGFLLGREHANRAWLKEEMEFLEREK